MATILEDTHVGRVNILFVCLGVWCSDANTMSREVPVGRIEGKGSGWLQSIAF